MDINELLNGVDCACGRRHSCAIDRVFIEKNAVRRLTCECAAYRSLLIVADENTYAAAGEKVVDALQSHTIRKVIFSGKNVLVPDEEAVRAVENALENADLILGVGSGVIQDLCKYVSLISRIPYMIVATAPSMDGYASSGAAMMMNGMKITYQAVLPKVIIGDTDILCRAPMDMIKAGYGDIIGKFSALNDWKLSRIVTGEYLCPMIYDVTYEQVRQTLQLTDGILNRNEESIQTLTRALVVIGIMMSFAGSSRPASGSEHHLSHFFEVTGLIGGTPYFPHGIDVACSTVITAKIRERILSRPFPRSVFRPDRAAYEKDMKRIYRGVSQGFIDLQDRAGHYAADRAALYLDGEDAIRNVLGETPSSEKVEEMLAKADIRMSDFYAQYGRKKIGDAVLYAKDIKDRYSVLWLNYDLFGDEKYAEY